MILERLMTGAVIGSLPGLAGDGRRISFRIVHVVEFRNGLISREYVLLDSSAIVDQLSRR
jgi:predicted ester cyclase